MTDQREFGASGEAIATIIPMIVLILVALGCDTQSPQSPTARYVGRSVPRSGKPVVSGQVLDFTTGLGVAGATVAFADERARFPPLFTTSTDASGWYSLIVPALGLYYALVDSVSVGILHVTGSHDRGDLFVRPGTCVRRYGTIADGLTLRPVAGATVTLGGRTVVTASDGWYQIDFGCPANGTFGFNTTFIYISRPNYPDYSEVFGRGIISVERRDVTLRRGR